MALVEIGKAEFEGRIKKLIIGDEMYITEHAEATDSKEKAHLKKLFFTRTDKKEIQSKVTAIAYDDTENDSALVVIHILDKQYTSMMKFNPEEDAITYRTLQGKKLKQRELGCDSASFNINGFHVHTGTDGVYGVIFEHPQQKESIIQLFVPTDVTDAKDFKDTIFAALPYSIAK